jgi:two-component system response regulator AtoC
MARALIAKADPGTERQLRNSLADLGYRTAAEADVPNPCDEAFLFCCVQVTADEWSAPAGAPGFMEDILARYATPGPIILIGGDTVDPATADPAALGADDFVPSASDRGELEGAITRVLSRRRLPPERSPVPHVPSEVGLWSSPVMAEVREIIERAAEVDVTVLITGETGTGKEVVARAIHRMSIRQNRPFVKVNCAAVPRELLESELFGHERGAFTGAHQLKTGKFEAANHGTIFLDEIGDLHGALQAKLLHVLQDGEFSRVGGKSTVKVNVRVLAATNQDLERAVAAGRFRDDLYYRLNVVQISVPPLRERREEIQGFVEYFVQRYSKQYRRDGFKISPAAMQRLLDHGYPGNVRELENLVKRMIVLGETALPATTLPRPRSPETNHHPEPAAEAVAVSLKDIARKASRAAEREAIARTLERTGWNRTKAASLLKISYRALLYKIKETGLDGGRSSSARSLP